MVGQAGRRGTFNERKRKAKLMEKFPEQRLFDLLRYVRSDLHNADLITDAEYALLLDDKNAVPRLEAYDEIALRVRLMAEKVIQSDKDNSRYLADADHKDALYTRCQAKLEETEAKVKELEGWLESYKKLLEIGIYSAKCSDFLERVQAELGLPTDPESEDER